MKNTLRVLLGDVAVADGLVDELVRFNDDMVRLVAPLGGVGKKCPPFFSFATLRLFVGLLRALPPYVRFLWHTGFTGLVITRPDKTLGRSNIGSGVWHHPHLLAQVPRYFLQLWHLWCSIPMSRTTIGLDGASTPTTPLEALRAAVQNNEITLAEALVTVVQLMVNMTSANALGNLVMRLCKETLPPINDDTALDAFVAEVLRLDAPLQRNPRRALADITIEGTTIPQGASVLLLLGAANMDPSVYESPECFKLGREEQSVSFGAGPHYCLGSYLVKAEMREALRQLLQTFKSFEVNSFERVHSVDVGNYGFESLHVAVKLRTV